jgi:hypothetical protein
LPRRGLLSFSPFPPPPRCGLICLAPFRSLPSASREVSVGWKALSARASTARPWFLADVGAAPAARYTSPVRYRRLKRPLSACYAVFAGPVGVRRVPAGSILSAANQ